MAAQQTKGEKVRETYLNVAYLSAISPLGCWVIQSCKRVFRVSCDKVSG